VTTTDRTFLLALAAVLFLMAALVAGPSAPAGEPPSASALEGEPRDLDVDLMRRRLIRRELSDREAMYYHRAGEEGR
jgi:hypothetical protein